MILCLLSTALYLPFAGFYAFVFPELGSLYLHGQKSVIDIAVAAVSSGPTLAVLIPSGLFGTIGSILFGIAIWRSGLLSKVAAVLYALHLPLLAFAPQISFVGEFPGALLLLVSGAWIAWDIWQHFSTVPAGQQQGVLGQSS